VIRVEPRPEPADFDGKVRKDGLRALAELRGQLAERRSGPKRRAKQSIESKDLPNYWTRCLDELHRAYRGLCAYSCLYIPYVVGSKTTDHFVAKASAEPEDAYEWSNYRLACGLMNSRKGTHAIIDPFTIEGTWFHLDLSTMAIGPSPQLPADLRGRVGDTIAVLGLDDDECRKARGDWYQPYLEGQISFSFLERKCPFLASEIVRQLGSVPEWRRPSP
jgi:hypothetical protein